MPSVITVEQMIPMLAESCPSFKDLYGRNMKSVDESDWYIDGEFLLYIALSDFSSHIVDLYESGKTSEFPQIFELIERLHVEGDGHVQEAATVGILEGIQNVAGNRMGQDVFVPFLLPETKKYWDELNKFWLSVSAHRDKSRQES